jgi:signal transduction histidine kinase
MKAVRLGAWTLGAALCMTLVAGAIRGDKLSASEASFAYGGALAVITIGVVVWRRRPDSRTGILLTAYAFPFLLSDLWPVFPRSAPAVTVGIAANWLGAAILVQIVLSYPTGRLTSRLDRGFVWFTYVLALVHALPLLFFYDPRRPHYTWFYECPFCAVPLTHVAWYDVTRTTQLIESVILGAAVLFLALVVRKLVRASALGRRVVLPLAAAAFFVVAQFGVQFAVFGHPVNSWTHSGWFWIVGGANLAVPAALAAGLLWGRSGRSAIADLVVDLEHAPPGSVRDVLARRLGDSSLEVALWLPGQHVYVNQQGEKLELPTADSERVVTVLGPPEAPIAALVHDPALLERRSLLEAAGAAARLALENERLQAELRAQLAELRASRARIVQAGDEERRRLERNLHDGAQQRLLGLGLALQLARAQLGPEANGTSDLLAEAEEELRAALDELRELAHGIHPAILTDQGLAAALRSLAERSRVPVSIVAVPDTPLGAPVEAAVYFLVSESLANVAKYADASAVRVSVIRRNGTAVVDVEDDGVGGADPGRGSGLRGLSDRVQALDGSFRVESLTRAGTRIHAELPCGS